MKEFNYTITDPAGIHARPAGILVKEAKKYKSSIAILKDGKSGDLKRIFSVMFIGETGAIIVFYGMIYPYHRRSWQGKLAIFLIAITLWALIAERHVYKNHVYMTVDAINY